MKYLRKYGLLLTLCALANSTEQFNLHAETVSQKEASRIAQTFFNAANGEVMGKPNLVYNGKKLTTDRLFSPFYVYNLPKGGFVIISAENKAMPILGYSLKDNFDPETMGEKTKALLTEYARDIEYIRYDSRIPEEAVAAWSDINGYIGSVLTAVYDVTDPAFSMEDAREQIENVENSGRWEDYASDIFTPSQWRDIINDEFKSAKSVALGIVGESKVYPVIVHGHKGDYYRIELDGRNDWLMRLMATEFMSAGQVAALGTPIEQEFIEEEEEPFLLYNDFIAETRAEEENRLRKFEERLIPTEPIVRSVGGGHFEIQLPEPVVLARTYNLDGMMVRRQTFRNTQVASISLDGNPNGFYFVILNGESGKPYGIKLYK
ncbi:MAG: hypothetical protein HDR88_06480 [Bacteroides sp.]|nr:hypothetical protein [Bacteroides sp.]